MKTRVRAGWGAGLAASLLAATFLTLALVGDLFIAEPARFGKATAVALRLPYGSNSLHQSRRPVADREHWRRVNGIVAPNTVLNARDPLHQALVVDDQSRRPPTFGTVVGAWVIFFALCLALTTYLRKFSQSRLRLVRTQVGLLGAVAAMFTLSKLVLLVTPLPAYWLPAAALPLWVGAAFDRRSAMLIALLFSFLLATLTQFDVLVLCVSLAQGLGAALVLQDRKHTRAMFWAGLAGGVSAAAMAAALLLLLEGQIDLAVDLSQLGLSNFIGCLGGGLVAGCVSSLLRSPAERSLGLVPRDRLHDLTDLEQPLLQHMAEHAPGSWEHSRAMANLAEAAASAIGADALLVRVGAYYHDLGKSVRHKFFVENHGPNEASPHDGLDPKASADVILAHVEEGTKILRNGGIPEPVVEFAYTHHGTQVVEYFWNKCKEAGNPEGYTEDDFRYPGMRPQTKETAILMLVDSIEAASRTVDPPERQAFETMVQRIVFSKLSSGQLDECGLRMRDLNVIVTRMTDTLVNMNHHRIKYPWQAKKAEQFGVPSRAVSIPPPPVRQKAKHQVGPTSERKAEPESKPVQKDFRATQDVPTPETHH